MTLNVNRTKLREAKAASPSAKFDRQAARAKILYGGGHGHAIDSLVNRFVARHADDPDLTKLARRDVPLLRGFLNKRGMTAEDAQTFTVGLLERDTFPRSPEAKKQLNEQNYDVYRKECGGFENAAAGIENGKRFWADFCKEVPFFGNRAVDQGANLDLPQVRIGARYGAAK
jgi:hypothetical protein